MGKVGRVPSSRGDSVARSTGHNALTIEAVPGTILLRARLTCVEFVRHYFLEFIFVNYPPLPLKRRHALPLETNKEAVRLGLVRTELENNLECKYGKQHYIDFLELRVLLETLVGLQPVDDGRHCNREEYQVAEELMIDDPLACG
jgi:hypothetical protein